MPLKLTAADVEACLPSVSDQIDIVKEALRSGTRTREAPTVAVHPRPDAVSEAMTAWLPEGHGVLGAAWVSAYPSNRAAGLARVSGLIILADPETGSPLALLDAGPIVAASTAAVSAAAAERYSGRVMTIAVLGAGVQARAHLAAFATLGIGQSARVFDRHADRADALSSWASQVLSFPTESAPSALAAVDGAQLVLSCAGHSGGIGPLRPADVDGAQIVIAIDADAYLSSSVVRADRWFVVDDLAQFANARTQGLVGFPEPDESLGEALLARTAQRPTRVAFLALGSGPCQLTVANAVFELAQRAGRGVSLN